MNFHTFQHLWGREHRSAWQQRTGRAYQRASDKGLRWLVATCCACSEEGSPRAASPANGSSPLEGAEAADASAAAQQEDWELLKAGEMDAIIAFAIPVGTAYAGAIVWHVRACVIVGACAH